MKLVHLVVGVVTIGLTGVAAAWGAWCWRLLRASQVAVVIEAVLGGVLLLIGDKSPGLHTLSGVLPLLVSFFAEQLRISSAQMVLDQRGFESAQDVGKLPEGEQRAIVTSILHRELGVMVLALVVNVVLLARAAMTGG